LIFIQFGRYKPTLGDQKYYLDQQQYQLTIDAFKRLLFEFIVILRNDEQIDLPDQNIQTDVTEILDAEQKLVELTPTIPSYKDGFIKMNLQELETEFSFVRIRLKS